MATLDFSLIARVPEETTQVQALVKQFSARQGVQVNLQHYTWDTVRQALNRVATYKQGLDVSQIGSTWLRDFVDMRAVRPFEPTELAQFGEVTDFVPAAWKSSCVTGDRTVWGIPWLIDARILFYRRDVLKRLGIDERGAFATPEALETTLARLQAGGVAIPWVVPTQFSWRTLHTVASWVWGYGGDFLTPDGKRIRFMEPEALAGFKAFFRTARYLAPVGRPISDIEADALFMQGEAAVTISGPWIMQMDRALLEQVGVASPPGPAFIGGSHLVIWQHTTKARHALNLVAYLTGPEAQRRHGFQGLLPARLSALDTVNIPTREFSIYLTEVLLKGRAFSSPHLWALVEERLSQTLAWLWNDVLALSDITDSALDDLLAQRLGSLAERLQVML